MDLVPRRDLVLPTKERASETSGLFGQLGVLEIVAESLDEVKGKRGIAVLIETANQFLRPPGSEHFTLGVTRVEQPHEFLSTVIGRYIMFGPGVNAITSERRSTSALFAVFRLFRRVGYTGHRGEHHCHFTKERLRVVSRSITGPAPSSESTTRLRGSSDLSGV